MHVKNLVLEYEKLLIADKHEVFYVHFLKTSGFARNQFYEVKKITCKFE